ncbi:MAG: Double-stranded RNA-specific editase B2 [Paramarteilia canceri]
MVTGTALSKKLAKLDSSSKTLRKLFIIDDSYTENISEANGKKNKKKISGSNKLNIDMYAPTLTKESVDMSKIDYENVGLVERMCKAKKMKFKIVIDAQNDTGIKWVQYFVEGCSTPLGSGKDFNLNLALDLAAYDSIKNFDNFRQSMHSNKSEKIDTKLNESINDKNELKDKVDTSLSKPKSTSIENTSDSNDKTIRLSIVSQLREFISQLKQKTNNEIPINSSIAAFFLKIGNQVNLVSFAAGTGLVESKYCQQNGRIILNSHAVSLARRALKRYLWFEVLNANNDNSSSSFYIFNQKEKLIFNENMDFILFTIKAPCGDASGNQSFETLNDDQSNCDHQDLWKDDSDKIETTVPSSSCNNDVIFQTFEDIQKYQLQLMSCTEKLSLWNILGYQGSLLNNFIETIYIPSIYYCGEISQEYMEWTTFEKLKEMYKSKDLQLPVDFISFKSKWINLDEKNPLADLCSHNKEADKFSINWYYPSPSPEVIDVSVGKSIPLDSEDINYQFKPSQLCKAAFKYYFTKSQDLHTWFKAEKNKNDNYLQLKKINKDYNEAKYEILKLFCSTQYGIWVKHEDLNEF